MPFFDVWDWTWGELVEYINVRREKERRKNQQKSIIAFRQAELISEWVWKKSDRNVIDVFPYWNDKEKEQYKVEHYKQIMMRYASNTNISE